ncbi:MAG: hypothetical protein M9908_06635 [Phyllobacteriaceae bacterium]|nr:hypothetical protein [Phyllobacteriaceae bacterium]
MMRRGGQACSSARPTAKQRITADTPVPYRMLDLLKLIEDRIGKLDGKAENRI